LGGYNEGFHHSHEIGSVNFPHAIHPRQREHDAPGHGNASANVSMTGAAGRDRNAVPVGEGENF